METILIGAILLVVLYALVLILEIEWLVKILEKWLK